MSRATEEINKVTGTVIGLSWKLIIIAIVILLLIEIAGRGYRFGYEVFAAEPMESAPGRDVTFTITSDESDLEVFDAMKEAGLIRDSYATLISAVFFDYTIYPGTYTMNTSMTSREMLDELSVKPEGYIEETEAYAAEETEEEYIPPTAAEIPVQEEVYDEEPSEMLWEAVEAEIEPEYEEDAEDADQEDIIEIRIE